MSQSAFDNSEGEELSLEKLSRAYAQALGKPLPEGEDAPSQAGDGVTTDDEPTDDETASVSPAGVLEALLFVGQPDNSALTAEAAAAVMRGVEPTDVEELVEELNAKYAEQENAFEIIREDDGFRLRLREEFARLRDVFHGRTREITLSQAAVDVLALVAYKQPITLEEINKLRGVNSGGTVRQLVRRKLIRFEVDEEDKRLKRYFTTRRMLNLLGLESLEDLPQSDDA